MVTGEGSRAVLPATVWLSNNSGDPGHGGGMDVLDGVVVEVGALNAGHSGGTLRLNVDGGTLRATDGIYCYRTYNRWTGGTFNFKDCLVETPVFKFTYPAIACCGDVATFDGAVFRPLGVPAAKFFDGPPEIAEKNAKFFVTGGGLIIDAPEGTALEASALLQGDGGFTKRGADRRIYPGDLLVVSAGGASVNDLGEIAVPTAAFPAGTGAHVVSASGAGEEPPVIPSLSFEAGSGILLETENPDRDLLYAVAKVTGTVTGLDDAVVDDTAGYRFRVRARRSADGTSLLVAETNKGITILFR
ncbi:MAG: hypothetical protein IJ678_08590 [Kiritimatiellae bacterium]|nr:hypothetical protein [Kiritimatiellia bacterium]